MRLLLTIILSFSILIGCQSKKEKQLELSKETIDSEVSKKLNILWLVTEDMGAYIPPFGDYTIKTPNLTRLAREGVIYPNLYSTSGVCAPSRAAIATGMYPSSIGANHMRTTSKTAQTGLKKYEAVPPSEVKMISELLRIKGYYTSNNYKEDYQFKAPVTAWNESSPYAHWRNRKENQPFFSVFNFTETHESGLFEPYGFRQIETRNYHLGDTSYVWKKNGLPAAKNRMTEAETPKHLSKDTKFNIPPYLPDTQVIRNDMWKLYNNIAEMDKQVGAVLKQLEDDGLLESTIIVFYGDHGGPLPRQKRLIYDSGLNTPMIIRFPNKVHAGTKDNQLISFVDFAPTLLSLVDTKPEKHMQGQAFLGEYKAKQERKYIHAAADRFDEVTDVIRAVRDKRFKYIRNYRPEQQYYLPLGYREKIPTMQELLKLHKEGRLNEIQKQWFRTHKPKEELFDCKADPHELINLAKDSTYAEKMNEMRLEMDRWLTNIKDTPNLPESELITKLWGGNAEKPETLKPEISISNKLVTVTCATKGASLGYRIKSKKGKYSKSWNVYQKPFEVEKGTVLQVKSHRIGYKASSIVTLNTSN